MDRILSISHTLSLSLPLSLILSHYLCHSATLPLCHYLCHSATLEFRLYSAIKNGYKISYKGFLNVPYVDFKEVKVI